MSSKPSILFFGSPEFGLICLNTLDDQKFPIVGVVTQPDKPSGRGQQVNSPECALWAKEKKLPLYQPASLKEEKIISQFQNLKPDFIVTAAYGKFLPESLLKISKYPPLNVHPSLLPKYRGAAPINWALINGDKQTGVTIMTMTSEMDAGDIYAQEICDIDSKDTTQSLTIKLAGLGSKLLASTIPLVLSGQIKPQQQDSSQVVFAPQLKKIDGLIDWNQSALNITNKIRGTNPWPGSYTKIDPSPGLKAGKKILKIYDGFPLKQRGPGSCGSVYLINEQGIYVICQDSSLVLTEVQLEGKKRMKASDFARGYRLQVGAQFIASINQGVINHAPTKK